MNTVTVQARFDGEAGVWYVEESNLDGLHAEAESLEALVAKLPGIVEDLIELNHVDLHGNVPIELIAHAHALATHPVYVIRQLIVLLKLMGGVFWGESPEVRAFLHLPAYPADPGTRRDGDRELALLGKAGGREAVVLGPHLDGPVAETARGGHRQRLAARSAGREERVERGRGGGRRDGEDKEQEQDHV